MKNSNVIKSILVIAAFIAFYFSKELLQLAGFSAEMLPENQYIRTLLMMLIQYSPVLIVSGCLFWKYLPALLGFRHSIPKSFGLALVFTLPMFIAFPFFFELNNSLAGYAVFKGALLAAVFEELAFRALVFGALYGVCGWRFLPAVLLTAVVFGFGHLYQAANFSGALLTFLVTFAGAVWFAWLYIKWEFNLFIPIFLHLLMNFSWMLFEVSSGAAGGVVANLARLATIIISILITLRYAGQQQNFSWKRFRVPATGVAELQHA